MMILFSSLVVQGLALWLSPVDHLGKNAVIAYLGYFIRFFLIGSWILGLDQLPIKVLL